MADSRKDVERYLAAVKTIVDGRNPERDRGSIMVTLEGTVAAVLVYVMGGDHRKAAAMLNEALVQGVEERIALAGRRRAKGKDG
ncbi:hypothetical protein [uncultured Paracoccus sp.]|uniref:hypothetical protein n=1 Tax=uncultured Paracoccus sp. TaxID=189685 RepID=UPI0025EE750B|nr:hypothetical protein [uncultured Paracoccus sp.]